MEPIRPLVAFGITVLVMVASAVIGYWPITVLAGLIGLFALIWGRFPESVHRSALRLPFGSKLDAWLTAGEIWVRNESRVARPGPEVIAQLQAFYHDGYELVDKFRARGNEGRALDWEVKVAGYLGAHVPSEQFDFETCHRELTDPKRRHLRKLEKLQAIIRLLNRSS